MSGQGMEEARRRDGGDPLARFRGRFHIPPGTLYMDGNSLGLASKDALASLERAAASWRDLGIRGWLEAKPDWFTYGERLGAKMAPLVGAFPDEVVLVGSTTANLHSLQLPSTAPREPVGGSWRMN